MRVVLPPPSTHGPPTAPRTLGGGPGPVCSLVVGGSKAQPSSFAGLFAFAPRQTGAVSREAAATRQGSGDTHPPTSLQISLRQGMRADPGALAALCEKTDNDIRACINALQVGRWLWCGGGGQGRPAPSPRLPCVHFLLEWGSAILTLPDPMSSSCIGGASGS